MTHSFTKLGVTTSSRFHSKERERENQLGAIIYENVFGTQMVSILTDSLSDKQIEYFVYCILCK